VWSVFLAIVQELIASCLKLKINLINTAGTVGSEQLAVKSSAIGGFHSALLTDHGKISV
jgi:hypothetical protein